MVKETKTLDFTIDSILDEERVIEGYASTNGIDSVNDRIEPTAFKDTIYKHFEIPNSTKGCPIIRFCREHDPLSVIGRLLDLRITEKGLYFKAYISKTQLGEDTYILLKDKAIDRVSIGFVVEEKEYEGKVRVIKKLRLYEISIVAFPANEEAEVISVKSMDESFNQLLKIHEEFNTKYNTLLEKQDLILQMLSDLKNSIPQDGYRKFEEESEADSCLSEGQVNASKPPSEVQGTELKEDEDLELKLKEINEILKNCSLQITEVKNKK